MMASAVDAEVAKFRELQESIQQLRSDQQILLGQSTENEMVLQELQLVDNNAKVYKMLGPALIPQNVEEAVQTVQKRLEFIVGEQQKLSAAVQSKEEEANELAKKIQSMQQALQQTTAQAVNAIRAQHEQKLQQEQQR